MDRLTPIKSLKHLKSVMPLKSVQVKRRGAKKNKRKEEDSKVVFILPIFKRALVLTLNVPVVCMAWDVTILMRANPFREPSPSNGPSNGFAPIKIIKSKCHTKNWYIGNFMYICSAAAV